MIGNRDHPLTGTKLAIAKISQNAGDGIILRALPFQNSIILRGESSDTNFLEAFRAALGFDLPIKPNHVIKYEKYTALWLGPNEWQILGMLIEAEYEQLANALEGYRHAIIPNGDSQQIIAISGPFVNDVLSKLCPLDLGQPSFGPGRCARSILAQCTILLHPQNNGTYHIHVGRSFADYVWRMLVVSAQEYGMTTEIDDKI